MISDKLVGDCWFGHKSALKTHEFVRVLLDAGQAGKGSGRALVLFFNFFELRCRFVRLPFVLLAETREGERSWSWL